VQLVFYYYVLFFTALLAFVFCLRLVEYVIKRILIDRLSTRDLVDLPVTVIHQLNECIPDAVVPVVGQAHLVNICFPSQLAIIGFT
jgi:hypothetical protein